MSKLKSILKWFGEGAEGVMDLFRTAPYLVFPLLGVLWMLFRLVDAIAFGEYTDSYYFIMMGMTIVILFNSEKKKDK